MMVWFAVGLWAVLGAEDQAALEQYDPPAPKWFLECGFYNGWYREWTEEVIEERLRGIPLIVGVPHEKRWIDAAHAAGVKVLPYVTFYQAPLEQPYQNATLKDHPEWMVRDEQGEPRKSVFWGEGGNTGWYEVCANEASFVEHCLAYVRTLLEMGADGVFIDNVHPSATCFGAQQGHHAHLYPDRDNIYAFRMLLKRVRKLVKEANPDHLVMLNPGGPSPVWNDCGDCQMWESYICTWASQERWNSWEEILRAARNWQPYVEGGKALVTLSYVGNTPYGITNDAFYCYACARLSGFLWADWFTVGDDPAKVLYAVRLGAPLTGIQEADGIFWRAFERGLVVVYPDPTPRREARTFFADTAWRAKKVLRVKKDEDLRAPGPVTLQFQGSTSGEKFQLVVSVNGTEVATFPAARLREAQWHEVTFDRALLRRENEVVFRVVGTPNYHPDYFNLTILTGPGGNSFWSSDGGQTYQQDDLSPDEGEQRGEYQVRLKDIAGDDLPPPAAQVLPPKAVTLSLPWDPLGLRDLFADATVPVTGWQVTLTLPPASGRVYVAEP